MENKKGKKILKCVLIILLILIISAIFYEIVIYSDGFVNQNNYMSRQEVVELLEKGKSYPNYYYSAGSNLDKTKTEFYIKDGVQKVIWNGEVIQWKNYNTNENIHILGEKDGKNYVSISSIDNTENKYSQQGFDYSLIADMENFNYNYKYLGEKEIDGRTTVIIEVWDKDSSELNSTKFYIDKETGLITKRVDYGNIGFLKIKFISDRNLQLNIVTDKDIEKPGLTKYEVLNFK